MCPLSWMKPGRPLFTRDNPHAEQEGRLEIFKGGELSARPTGSRYIFNSPRGLSIGRPSPGPFVRPRQGDPAKLATARGDSGREAHVINTSHLSRRGFLLRERRYIFGPPTSSGILCLAPPGGGSKISRCSDVKSRAARWGKGCLPLGDL